MGRKCSDCGKTGHNSRTCSIHTNSTRLFGVRLYNVSSLASDEAAMTISFTSTSPHLPSSSQSTENISDKSTTEYLSDSIIAETQERRKGVAWTETEHRNFLLGLKKLGKGDWRGISKKFVTTRTPKQVASHAQKYFIRHSNTVEPKKNRRSSLFDMTEGTQSQANSSNPGSESSQFHATVDFNWTRGLSSPKRSSCYSNSSPNEDVDNLELTLAPSTTSLLYHQEDNNDSSLTSTDFETIIVI